MVAVAPVVGFAIPVEELKRAQAELSDEEGEVVAGGRTQAELSETAKRALDWRLLMNEFRQLQPK